MIMFSMIIAAFVRLSCIKKKRVSGESLDGGRGFHAKE
jgi:hypothetical protein